MGKNDKRSKKMIDRRIQGAVAGRFVLYLCTFVAVASGLTLLVQFMVNPFRETSWYARNFWSTNGPYLLVLIALMPVIVWDTVKLTNRIVGPICRMREHFRSINRGEEPGPCRFRKGDFWQDLASEVDTLSAELRQLRAEQATREADSEHDTPETAQV